MSNLTPQESFRQKLEDRIRQDIADLIPDELLQEMVKRGFNNIFHRPAVEHQREQPSMFEKLVFEVLRDDVQKAVKEWANENPDVIKEHIEKCLGDNLVRFFLEAVNERISMATDQLKYQLSQVMMS